MEGNPKTDPLSRSFPETVHKSSKIYPQSSVEAAHQEKDGLRIHQEETDPEKEYFIKMTKFHAAEEPKIQDAELVPNNLVDAPALECIDLNDPVHSKPKMLIAPDTPLKTERSEFSEPDK